MKMVRFGAGSVAALLCALMVVSVTSVAVASPPNKELKLVATEQVGPLCVAVPEDPAILAALQELVPVGISFLTGVRYICVDGMVHINAMISEKKGTIDVDLHLVWHGTIALCNEDMQPLITLDVKVLQVHLKAIVPASDVDGLGDLVLKLNLKLNADLIIDFGEDAVVYDLSAHLLLKFQDGQVTKVKVWLPDVLDLLLWET